MNKLKLVQSENFGDVKCDIYQSGEQFYMTREQIGAALEYGDGNKAIANIHARVPARLDKFSTTLKMRGVDGKLRAHTVYTRKGIMEICRHSNQPKADAFMDWVWDVMDKLISGKATLTTTTKSLGYLNSAARIISDAQKDAGVAPGFRVLTLKQIYAPAGIDIPMDGITMPQKLFEATEIANQLGVLSKSGNPHGQAISAIIGMLDLEDGEREVVPFQNQQSGHIGNAYQFTESVIGKVRDWLDMHNYPTVISAYNRQYKVFYRRAITA